MASEPKVPEADPLDEICRIFERLRTAVWIFDFDLCRVVWANAAALDVWGAETVVDLRARELSEDMSASVRTRLDQFRSDFVDPAVSGREVWTLYPNGKPRTLDVEFRGHVLPDGRLAMLCEGTEVRPTEPETLRSVQALLHMPVGIALFSASGEPLYLNPSARGAQDDLHCRLVDRFCDAAEGARFFAALALDGTSRTVARMHTVQGERWQEITASRCNDSATGEEAYLVSAIDVTELKEAEQRAEAADIAKSEFLATMSHELRTPLNAVIGFADFIMSGPYTGDTPDKVVEYVGDIHDSGVHLLQVINDILDLAKIETGEMPFVLEKVEIADTFDQLDRLLKLEAQKAGIRLSICAGEDDLSVLADALRFRQVMMNLLSNAIKFTEPGGSIVLQAIRQGDEVVASVRDTGIGMTPEVLEECLLPFRQADNSTARQFGGTGLGLPLSKSLLEHQGGTLDIRSEAGAGTEVIVSLPVYPAVSTLATGVNG